MIKKNIWLSLGLGLFLFIISFVLYLNFTYMGAANKEIEELIFGQFKGLLLMVNLKILLAYLTVALIVAGFAILLKLKKIHTILLFNIFFWFMFWIRGIKLFPQLFIQQLFSKGFVLKYFQVLVTDHIPFFLIHGLFILTIIAVGVINKRWIYSFIIIGVSFLIVAKIPEFAVTAESPNSRTKPNILIFATDSLRPQAVSYNGNHRKTPNIDKLFAEGANFLNAKNSMGRTLPTWTTIMTSTYPPDHKLRHMFPTKEELVKKWTTMVDVFNKNQYYTAVVSDFAGDIFPSVPYGFQNIVSPNLSIPVVLKQRCQEIHYFLLGFLINPLGRTFFPEIWGMALNKDPWYVTEYTKKSIKESIKKKKPFFVLSFSSNNHFPYVTAHPYYNTYTEKNYNGRHKYGLSSDILETFLEGTITEDEKRHIVDHYDNATKMFDDNLGEILEYLEDCNVAENTIVIIMSDHGENLYEENYGLAHGDHLLGNYATNMVFGIYSPMEKFGGKRIKETVRDIDIAPTLLEAANLEIPDSFRGTSLMPVIKGQDFKGLPAYMETGVWYSPTTPFIVDKARIPYPGIVDLLEVQMPLGKIVLKKKWEKTIIKAKYKGYQLNGKKYIYMPGENHYQEEYYIDEKKVDIATLDDEEFATFKQKIVEMFKDKFYIDEKGFIREHITEPQKLEVKPDSRNREAKTANERESETANERENETANETATGKTGDEK
ncbi:MAG: sulfatase-like hydrolase/transferase [bacterium]|nr:sulfatase-like hydrolase/transferase [bacterium]